MGQNVIEKSVDSFEKFSVDYSMRKAGPQSPNALETANFIQKILTSLHDRFMKPNSPLVERDSQGHITRITAYGLDEIVQLRAPSKEYQKPTDFPVERLLDVPKGVYKDLLKKSVEENLRESLNPDDHNNWRLMHARDVARLIGKDLNDPKVFKEYSGLSFQEYGAIMLGKMRDDSTAQARANFAAAEVSRREKHTLGEAVRSFFFVDERAAQAGQEGLLRAFQAAGQAMLYDAYLGKTTTQEAVLGTDRSEIETLTEEFRVVGFAHTVWGRRGAHRDYYELPINPDLAKPQQSQIREALDHKFNNFDSLLDYKSYEYQRPPEKRLPNFMERMFG